MTDILAFLVEKLDEIEVPYEYGEWTQKVTYPYFVGTFDETEYRYEDDCTTGIFTLDGWSRGSKIALTQAADKIRDAFADLQEVRDDVCYFVRYSGAQGIPSGEADLYRISITLYTYEWKGD